MVVKNEETGNTKEETVLKAWAEFCKEYTPTKLTEREITVFRTGQVAKNRVEMLHHAAKEVVR
ncbi:MAG: hypothetical protein ABSD38_26675 [Syntrophorhabdales bacterium]|jgi:hypothetical protein